MRRTSVTQVKHSRKSPILKKEFINIPEFSICWLIHLARGLLVADPEEVDEPGPVGEQRGQEAGQRGEDEAGRPPGDAQLQQHEAEAQPEAGGEVNNPVVVIIEILRWWSTI